MGTAREDCIWYSQCGNDCCEGCDDFFPIDCSDEDVSFYQQILKENAEYYGKLAQIFSGEEEIQFEP